VLKTHAAFQNPYLATDVTNDGILSPADLGRVLAEIATNGIHSLNQPFAGTSYVDVNGDGGDQPGRRAATGRRVPHRVGAGRAPVAGHGVGRSERWAGARAVDPGVSTLGRVRAGGVVLRPGSSVALASGVRRSLPVGCTASIAALAPVGGLAQERRLVDGRTWGVEHQPKGQTSDGQAGKDQPVIVLLGLAPWSLVPPHESRSRGVSSAPNRPRNNFSSARRMGCSACADRGGWPRAKAGREALDFGELLK